MSKKVRGWLCIAMGVIMLAAAGTIYMLQEKQDQMAGKNSEILLEKMREEILYGYGTNVHPISTPAPTHTATPVPEIEPEPSEPPAEVEEAPPVESAEPELPVMELYGYELMGILTAPSVEVELPILGDWNYELLQIAPCRYSGSVAGEDLILLGHNFKSHFDSLKNIAVDDPVEFLSADGELHKYTVAEIELLHKTDVDKLERDEYALTFFTCTRGGEHRLVIRCVPVEEPEEEI